MPITNTVSTFIQSQVPEFISGNPNSQFVAFLKAYYTWMETTANNDIINQSKKLPTYWDIDQTSSAFIQYFINEFLPYFPNVVAADERKLIKAAREFYQKKGSADSIQFLFRVLYNKEADIYFPKNQVLKTSDGKWYQPKLIRLQLDPILTANNFNYQQLVGRQGLGSISNASCVIESVITLVDPSLGVAVLEIFISNVNRPFNNQENLNVVFGTAANGAPLVFSERIISSISKVVIASPGFGGLKYRGTTSLYPGDPVTFIGGLAPGDPNAQKAVGYVNTTSLGSVTGVSVLDGSFFYRAGANTLMSTINAIGDTTGGNANLIVDVVDVANAVNLLIPSDAIQYHQNTALNVASFSMANFAFSNINTVLSTAFTYANLQFANITHVSVISGGAAYSLPPNIAGQVVYYTDYCNDLSANGSGLLANSVQPIDDLGMFAAIRINNPGAGYSNVTDKIVVPSAVGYGATFDFVTSNNATGNTITSVLVTARGNGYFYLPTQLAIANSANVSNAAAGAGAVLTGYGFGQGASFSTAVNQIGIINDFRLGSRGFDYISAPRISLRNEDIILIDPTGNLAFITDQPIYQGANAKSGTFVAYVDSYNVAARTLRVYDYQGNLNTAQNVIYAGANVTINTAAPNFLLIYGNGQANANAIFIPGLQKLPGFFYNTDGMLSADKYLQDSNTYHNYSYKVIVEKALNEYKNTLMALVHPSGMSMIGDFIVPASNISNHIATINIGIQPNVSGTVSANAFDANAIIVGVGTSFTTNANVGDLIVFNTADTSRKLLVKEILAISNNLLLKLSSNTSWLWPYGASVTNTTNTIVATGIQGNIAVNDIVNMNISGNSLSCLIQNVIDANTVNCNTTFNVNASNLMLLVFPSMNTANYSIMQQPL